MQVLYILCTIDVSKILLYFYIVNFEFYLLGHLVILIRGLLEEKKTINICRNLKTNFLSNGCLYL